ncbi:probable serine/threonine-protein kinase PBL11 isoform X2 [Chenopodium quinoa]|uniref:probable serine/threonine-protein kinase PBL11 isoform X2 n=1 Tax=Chenopodium quinoa TaxID=63459 RepID=UPI000B7712F8|nr:probable serine/threonine-protein kinase PBL11 isoform X2 [Chenopodium quinoa]
MGNCLGSPAPPDYFDLEGARLEQRNTQNLISTSLKAFSLEEIETITKDFHVDNLIRTYFPYFVFKGWINKKTLAPSTPETGMAVAVNKMQPDCFPGNQTEWLEKIIHLSKLHHPNLVKLIGYRLENEWEKFSPYHWYLVSTFQYRGNLDNYLYGREGTRALSWEKRMKVAIGAAKGLSFLHDAQPEVIYRYLDATNILLDDDYTPKLSAYLSTQVRDIQGYALKDYLSPGYSSLGYAAPEFVDTRYRLRFNKEQCL